MNLLFTHHRTSRIMNKHLQFALSLPLTLLPCVAMAIDVQPGLWTIKAEMKNTIKAVQIPGAAASGNRFSTRAVGETHASTDELCLSDKTAKDMRVLVQDMSQHGHEDETCVAKESEPAANRVRIVLECSSKGTAQKRSGAVTLTKIDDKSFTFRSRSELDESHQVIVTSNAVWAGASCGNVKPQ